MAELIPAATFAELEDIAGALLEKARETAAGRAIVAPGAPPEEVVLTEETQAATNALMAVCRVTPLEAPALFVALGAAVGTILAQSGGPHAGLLRLMRNQERSTYDEVLRASTPKTRTMQ